MITASIHPSIEEMQDQLRSRKYASGAIQNDAISFQSILSGKQAETESLKFSKHASERLDNRSIDLTVEIADRLSEGAKRAEEKGIKDSLVVVDSYAFIVNIPSHTVVTAMDRNETEDHTFTNIDGAVIA